MVENKIEYKPTTSITLFKGVTKFTDASEYTKIKYLVIALHMSGFC